MDTIQIKDKRFTPFIPEERILKRSGTGSE